MFDIDFEFEVGHLENGIWFPNQTSDDSRVDIKFCIKNNSQQTIKYVEPEFIPLDKNRKILRCKFFDYDRRIMEIKRLIYPNQTYCLFFENMWYNENIDEVYLLYCDISYTTYKYETLTIRKSSFISK